MKDKRRVWDRRDEDRRRGERRKRDQRRGERRAGQRREERCPTCGATLTPADYCRHCKVRVIRIRSGSAKPAAKR